MYCFMYMNLQYKIYLFMFWFVLFVNMAYLLFISTKTHNKAMYLAINIAGQCPRYVFGYILFILCCCPWLCGACVYFLLYPIPIDSQGSYDFVQTYVTGRPHKLYIFLNYIYIYIYMNASISTTGDELWSILFEIIDSWHCFTRYLL